MDGIFQAADAAQPSPPDDDPIEEIKVEGTPVNWPLLLAIFGGIAFAIAQGGERQ